MCSSGGSKPKKPKSASKSGCLPPPINNKESLERALLAQNVYDSDPNSAPEGWTRIKDFSTAEDKNNGFHAALYESNEDGTKVLAFEGTEMSSWQDWKTNLKQGMGMESYQYSRAMELAEDLEEIHGDELELVGHSLGGGLASAGAGVTGLKTSTFNSAGLKASTVERAGGSIETAHRSVTSRYVEGEILTKVQSLPLVSDAVGNLSAIKPALEGGSVAKHGMEHVIAAIEKEIEKNALPIK